MSSIDTSLLRPYCGTNFVTHQLVQYDPMTLAFVPTTKCRFFYTLLFLVGGALGVAFFMSQPENAPPLLIMSVVFLVSGVLFRHTFGRTRFIRLDRRTVEASRHSGVFGGQGRLVAFGEIRALQLIGQKISIPGKRPHMSYELNLVLYSGGRVNVVRSSSLKSIREEAHMLADTIECELFVNV